MTPPLRQTPLLERHRALGARLAPFAGWEMPIQYSGILTEHQATRTGAAVFDICHMGEFVLRGPTALADLERLVTLNVATIAIGQTRYGFLCREDGGVLDDLTVYRHAPDHFMLVVNAGTRDGDREWITARLSPDTVFEDISDRTAKLDVQGPRSREVMEAVFGRRMPELGYFRFTETELGGVPTLLSRTGYTGEFGYELYFPWDKAGDQWDRLLAGGATPVGLGARDTLRLEVGYSLYGHELGEARSPVAATRGTFIAFDKEFVGAPALRRDRDQGCPRYLCGIALEGRQAARAGAAVQDPSGRTVGEVTSGSLAPSLDRAVALAYVDAALTAPGTRLALEVRGKPLPGVVADLPFYTQGSARRKTAG
jgi:aminomethyltransferase